MRKTERQITDPQVVREIVAGCEVMRVTFNDPEAMVKAADVYRIRVRNLFVKVHE